MMKTKIQQVTRTMTETEESGTDEAEPEFWRKPLDKVKKLVKEGHVHVIENRCKGCGFCIEFCPKQVLVQSNERNEKGYYPPIVKNPDDCVFCELCELMCPDFAIFIEVTKSNEDEVSNKNKNNKSNNGK